jgi:hypothetical protein
MDGCWTSPQVTKVQKIITRTKLQNWVKKVRKKWKKGQRKSLLATTFKLLVTTLGF